MSEPPGAADSLLDTLRIGVVILDTGGRFLLWTPTIEALLGWRSDEVAGRRFLEFLDEPEREPDPAPRICRELRRGNVWRGIIRGKHRDGSTVELEARAVLLHDADGEPFILANVVEVSRLRAIEHDLAALDALFDSSLGIALCDEQKRFVPVDKALLEAQLGGPPEDSSVCWSFPAESRAVRRARVEVRRALRRWGLDALSDETALLVSELVTNSLRYACGPIGVRMVRGSSLLVEVSDPLPDPPRERVAGADDEGGRGIQLVARSARRWGTRHGPIGKTVWFELPLP